MILVENDKWNTDIDTKVINWIENDKEFTVYKHTCVDMSNEYYINKETFVYTINNGIKTKVVGSGKWEPITSDKLIELLAEPTVVKLSGYVGEAPDSPLTVSIIGKNTKCEVCNNCLYNQYGLIKTLKNWIIRRFKLRDVNSTTLKVEYCSSTIDM